MVPVILLIPVVLIKMKNIPQHIAIIMDGNRRWARERGLPTLAGHKKVTDEILEPLIEHAADRGVKFITFWAWSTENWQRSSLEVRGIMAIFRQSLKTFGEKMHRKNIRIRIIGELSRFAGDIGREVNRLIDLTKDNKRITVVFALNYGGRDEILRAVKKVILERNEVTTPESKKSGFWASQNDETTEEEFEKHMDTVGMPDPDIIIRPGGEKRLSGFMLWQSEYSELYFADWYMPEFTPEKLDEILADFQNRQRRFGR
ncbi:MAG: Isoprenyl transferase [Candidatus Gottesmanbacteria bacterium GW2011_GWB1_43_11]|uniref:Isoprenyl transferase n=1 Tax=Candidatus Gottesmanbacteria bacterium GW2011_GWB1_43_11 TaxID=1618446 RepID=A0A0G1CKW0_9BACT|nr:MAG: Isoprenyl transferase [Candidatus Gottesmanbacteria bacterium GW2011_GWA2_42_16]KKS53526.1 MAG: Isoprenyl transferase [Candidatus Gottesmanbacteria bacterium GW2011_GWA1_42_26]KKS81201.1 MAG: Isoprenyl transferase [Candidatus Gottesmanbacteria bacterium GW2011_GWC1_43_10]KKS86460.1 MAG: Isoprenyl transferase [Candidatus Gottesmanbacteria bacterium GW2011_GWB1_43_11]